MPTNDADMTPDPDSSYEVTTDTDDTETLLTITMNGPTAPGYVSVTIGLPHDPDVVDVEHATDAAASAIVAIRKELR